MPDKEKVSGCKFFSGLTSEEVEKVLSICREESFKKDEVIINESAPGLDIHLILKGQAAVELETTRFYSSKGGKIAIATLLEGDIVGEIAFLEKGRSSARVTAIGDVEALVMSNEKLHELFEADNHLGYVMIKNLATILSKRLLDLNVQWRDNL